MSDLAEPAHYFPPRKGQQIVAPGLFRWDTPFGNGTADTHLFQLDTQFPRYRENKKACRAERFNKYVCFSNFDDSLAEATTRFIMMRLIAEHPMLFSREADAEGGAVLHCRLTGERLSFDSKMNFAGAGGKQAVQPPYTDTFDALCCQVQEDVAVVRQPADGTETVCALHLCAPSHWAAEAKIGRSFAETHAPVPHFEKIAAAARPLQASIQERGPFVRFAWGIEFDDLLNHHPEPPPQQQCFTKEDVPFYLRVERQGLWGLPLREDAAYLFTIRVYVYPATDLSPAQCAELAAALRAMSPESLRYKGLAERAEEILSYLANQS